MATAAKHPAPTPPAWSGANQNAYTAMMAVLASYGLSSLAGTVKDLVTQGYSGDALNYMVQQTDAYKQRFAGNEQRIKNGLQVLTPGEYLAAEAAYRSVLDSAGLPAGFHDDQTALAHFIGNDVSPNEIGQRVAMAQTMVANADPAYKDALKNLYGMSEGDMAAYLLDGKTALPLLQKNASAVSFAASEQRNGLKMDNANYAESIGALGLSDQDIANRVSTAAQNANAAYTLGDVYGKNVSQNDVTDAFVAGTAQATAKLNKLASQERATFNGSSGIGQNSLSGTRPGSY